MHLTDATGPRSTLGTGHKHAMSRSRAFDMSRIAAFLFFAALVAAPSACSAARVGSTLASGKRSSSTDGDANGASWHAGDLGQELQHQQQYHDRQLLTLQSLSLIQI